MRAEDKMVRAAPPGFVARARELLAGPHPETADGYPFQLGNRRNRHAMNSWLNELPDLHHASKRNDVVIPMMRGPSASATSIRCGCSRPSARSNSPHRSATNRDVE